MPERGEAEFEAFYRAHVSAVYAYARSQTSPERAADIVEETFLVAWRRLDDVSPEFPRAWLVGVARKLLANDRRALLRREALGLRILAMRAEEYRVSDAADQVVEKNTVLLALKQVPQADRELLSLIAWVGLTPEETAAVLGCTRPTLLMRLHRARRRLTLALAAEEAAESKTAGVPRPIPAQLAKEPLI